MYYLSTPYYPLLIYTVLFCLGSTKKFTSATICSNFICKCCTKDTIIGYCKGITSGRTCYVWLAQSIFFFWILRGKPTPPEIPLDNLGGPCRITPMCCTYVTLENFLGDPSSILLTPSCCHTPQWFVLTGSSTRQDAKMQPLRTHGLGARKS